MISCHILKALRPLLSNDLSHKFKLHHSYIMQDNTTKYKINFQRRTEIMSFFIMVAGNALFNF